MGRKKIQISRIGDERNRQVSWALQKACNTAMGQEVHLVKERECKTWTIELEKWKSFGVKLWEMAFHFLCWHQLVNLYSAMGNYSPSPACPTKCRVMVELMLGTYIITCGCALLQQLASDVMNIACDTAFWWGATEIFSAQCSLLCKGSCVGYGQVQTRWAICARYGWHIWLPPNSFSTCPPLPEPANSGPKIYANLYLNCLLR